MTDFLCVRDADLAVFAFSADAVQNYVQRHLADPQGPLRMSRAGGIRMWEIRSDALLLAQAQQIGAHIVRTEILFPARMRWGHERGDRLFALTVVPDFLGNHPQIPEILTGWSRRYLLPIDVVDGRGGQVEPGATDRITVVIYGSPEPVHMEDLSPIMHVTRLGSVFGPPLIPQSASAEALDDTAMRVGNTVYLRAPFVRNAVGLRALQALLGMIRPDLTLLSEEARLAHSQAQIAQIAPLGLQQMRGQLRDQESRCSQARTDAEAALRSLQQREAEIRGRQARMASFADDTEVRQIYTRQLSQFEQMDKVLEVSFDADLTMSVRTTHLLITNPKTHRKHLGGAYMIQFSAPTAYSAMPTLVNLTRLINGTHHPHCQPTPCWGNMAEMLPPLMNQGEYAAATSMVIAYLEACNPDDPWGRSIENWPQAVA